MKVLLLTPPLTQLNTPYPATAYLTGCLRSFGFDAVQADPAIRLFGRLFSKAALIEIEECLRGRRLSRSTQSFLDHAVDYQRLIDPVVRFLRGRMPALAHRICAPGFLPEGPRFRSRDELSTVSGLDRVFGEGVTNDRAKFLATLFIQDIADAIREGIDERFELSRYAEKLALSASSLDPILIDLDRTPTLIDRYLDEIATALVESHTPDFLGITVPFPGNLYGALRIARVAKLSNAKIKVIVGGGYINTELRSLSDHRFFDFVDYVTLDDGERPLLSILEGDGKLCRTFVREHGRVVYRHEPSLHDIPMKDRGMPTYDGLPIGQYVSLLDIPNPMHRLWSDGWWNKLTLAHGCYWKRCTFCDTSLDYIGRYESESAKSIVDKMEVLIRETGERGFHFVDEAAPPALLRALSDEILARGLSVSWWTNIRFEKSFTRQLSEKMAKAGCIALSGGLEVASNRLLALMEKGVTVEQVAQVTHHLREAGILVHAYLMFGFPSQTVSETIDALERVRQLFRLGCISSAYWHRFSATVHSPVGKSPRRYGIDLLPHESTFARNDLPFTDSTGIDHERFHFGLKKALHNFMHGVALDEDVRAWFDFPVPKPRVAKRWAELSVAEPAGASTSTSNLLH